MKIAPEHLDLYCKTETDDFVKAFEDYDSFWGYDINSTGNGEEVELVFFNETRNKIIKREIYSFHDEALERALAWVSDQEGLIA